MIVLKHEKNKENNKKYYFTYIQTGKEKQNTINNSFYRFRCKNNGALS